MNAKSAPSRFPALHLLLGIWMASMAFSQAAEPLGVAEFSFDKRYETAEAFAKVARPAWITGMEQSGGAFFDDPACWHVPATAADGTGKLAIGLDRSKISGDLAATLLFSAEQSSDLAVQLFDDQGRAVVVDLFGNLIDVGGALSTNTFIISLNKYPTATRIVLRQVHGPVTVYGLVLFPVASEGEMVVEEVKKLAQRLGDPLSPDNPILRNLQNVATHANAVISSAAPRQPMVSSSGKTLADMAKTKPAACMMTTKTTASGGCICVPGAKTTVVMTDPPAIPSVRPFKQPVTVLIEDSHGGTDIFNEYNFGSAQLGRILTAQGAKVMSTREAPDFDPAAGLNAKVLAHFNVVIFNGRFNGRTKAFTESEIQAVSEWVKAGGGLAVTCSSPTSSDKLDAFYFNPLIAPYGLQFASRGLGDVRFQVTPSDKHPILSGLEGFQVFHGTAVAGQAEAKEVLPSAHDSVMLTRQFGKGRVVAFGGGSAIQNQALNSKVIHHAKQPTVSSNTRLAMNLALWLAGGDDAVASN